MEAWSPERIASLRTSLREHTINILINLEQLKKKTVQARTQANIAWMKNPQSYQLPNLNSKADLALTENLSEETKRLVNSHGLALSVAGGKLDSAFAVETLVDILVSGELRGDWAPISGYVPIYGNAPFILLSNKGEGLTAISKDGVQKVTGLRTVLVNGEYEGIIGELKRAFPFVSFRTADQINDAVFDKIDPPYKSYSDREEEEISRRIKD